MALVADKSLFLDVGSRTAAELETYLNAQIDTQEAAGYELAGIEFCKFSVQGSAVHRIVLHLIPAMRAAVRAARVQVKLITSLSAIQTEFDSEITGIETGPTVLKRMICPPVEVLLQNKSRRGYILAFGHSAPYVSHLLESFNDNRPLAVSLALGVSTSTSWILNMAAVGAVLFGGAVETLTAISSREMIAHADSIELDGTSLSATPLTDTQECFMVFVWIKDAGTNKIVAIMGAAGAAGAAVVPTNLQIYAALNTKYGSNWTGKLGVVVDVKLLTRAGSDVTATNLGSLTVAAQKGAAYGLTNSSLGVITRRLQA